MRIPIVDDQVRIRRYLSSLVTKLGDPATASTGEEALAAVKQALDSGSPYELVLLDIGLPDLDGISALESIRSMEEAAGLATSAMARVVMITGLVDANSVIGAFHAQCEAYLPKPFTEVQFWKALHTAGVPTAAGPAATAPSQAM